MAFCLFIGTSPHSYHGHGDVTDLFDVMQGWMAGYQIIYAHPFESSASWELEKPARGPSHSAVYSKWLVPDESYQQDDLAVGGSNMPHHDTSTWMPLVLHR
jgi:hypothetical protein